VTPTPGELGHAPADLDSLERWQHNSVHLVSVRVVAEDPDRPVLEKASLNERVNHQRIHARR
jgi:hypothetical protein